MIPMSVLGNLIMIVGTLILQETTFRWGRRTGHYLHVTIVWFAYSAAAFILMSLTHYGPFWLRALVFLGLLLWIFEVRMAAANRSPRTPTDEEPPR